MQPLLCEAGMQKTLGFTLLGSLVPGKADGRLPLAPDPRRCSFVPGSAATCHFANAVFAMVPSWSLAREATI